MHLLSSAEHKRITKQHCPITCIDKNTETSQNIKVGYTVGISLSVKI